MVASIKEFHSIRRSLWWPGGGGGPGSLVPVEIFSSPFKLTFLRLEVMTHLHALATFVTHEDTIGLKVADVHAQKTPHTITMRGSPFGDVVPWPFYCERQVASYYG